MGNQFVLIPNTRPPRWSEVPDQYIWPKHRWRKAPEEHGGEYWYVYPFTGEEPWLTQGGPVKEPDYPAGFIETFPKPRAKDFPIMGVSYPQAMSRWKRDLEVYKGVERDPEVTEEQWQNARKAFLDYGMGEPKPFRNVYRHAIRFPQSKVFWWEIDGYSPAADVLHEITRYQVSLVLAGEDPGAELTPYFPKHLLG